MSQSLQAVILCVKNNIALKSDWGLGSSDIETPVKIQSD